MLMALATNSSSTMTPSTGAGNISLMLAASPLPVTRPMRAAIICTADISGKVRTMVHSRLKP